jgi:hypothetical protein
MVVKKTHKPVNQNKNKLAEQHFTYGCLLQFLRFVDRVSRPVQLWKLLFSERDSSVMGGLSVTAAVAQLTTLRKA